MVNTGLVTGSRHQSDGMKSQACSKLEKMWQKLQLVRPKESFDTRRGKEQDKRVDCKAPDTADDVYRSTRSIW